MSGRMELVVGGALRLFALGLAVGIGHAVSVSPASTLVALAGAGVMSLMMVRPKIALLTLIALSFFDDMLIDLARGIPVVKIIGATVIFGWLLHRLVTRGIRPFRVGRVEVALAVFGGVCVLSVIGAVDPALAKVVLSRYVLFFVLVVVIADQVDTPLDVRNVGWALIVGAAASAPFGLYSFLFGGEFRATGPLSQPNDFAFVLSLALVFAYFMLHSVRGVKRMLLISAMLLIAAAMLATFSRGTMVGLGAGFVWGLAQGKVQIRYVLAAAMGALVVIVAVYTANSTHVSTSYRLKSNYGEVTVVQRVDRWAAALQMLAEHPVLGVGLGSYRVLKPAYAGLQVVDEGQDVSHNMYLEIAAESGLVGLASFMTVIGLSLALALQNASALSLHSKLRRMPCLDGSDPPTASLTEAASMADAVAVGMIAVLAAAVFSTKQYQPPLWILLGLVIGMHRMRSRGELVEPSTCGPADPRTPQPSDL